MSGNHVIGMEINLPVGIEKDGVIYKKLTLDRKRGVDDENMSSSECENNGQKASSILLRRAIQEFPGILERKPNPNQLIPEDIVLEMTEPDRATCIVEILSQYPDAVTTTTIPCQQQTCDLSYTFSTNKKDLEFTEFDPDVPMQFELNDGVIINGTECFICELRLLTGLQTEELGEIGKINAKNLPIIQTANLFYAIKSIDGLPITKDVIRNMTSDDRIDLSTYIMKNTPGYNLFIEEKCSCGGEVIGVIDVANFSGTRRKTKKK